MLARLLDDRGPVDEIERGATGPYKAADVIADRVLAGSSPRTDGSLHPDGIV